MYFRIYCLDQFYFMDLCFIQQRCWQVGVYSVEWYTDLCLRNCRKCGRNRLWPNLRLCLYIFVDKNGENYINAVKMDHGLCRVLSLEYSGI